MSLNQRLLWLISKFWVRMASKLAKWTACICDGESVRERTVEFVASKIRLEAEVRKRIEIEQDLKKSISETNRANLAKAEFLSNISHEIRTPLNAVVGYSELLVENHLKPEERDTYAKAVRKNGRLLAAIIGDILDLSKIVNGAIVLEKNNIEIATILSEVVELFDFELLNKSLSLKVSVLDNAPSVIIADHIRLKQILVNLVGNAVKFTQTGSVTIIVDRFEKERFLSFAVIDTGIGIPHDRRDLIFDPFTQVDSSTSKKYGGTGLGLTISRALAQMMGGYLVLKESKLDHGSTFLLHIPLACTVDQVVASNLLQVENKPLTGLKILVVDDALDNQVLLQHMLSSFGASSIDLAADGDEGIRLGLTETYDLILMDLQMPRIDGFQATKTLRKAEVRTPIIAVTAHAMADVKERVMIGGFSEFIAKPVLSGILVTTILGVLGKKQGHAQPYAFAENSPNIQETMSIV